jgi:hypothetical protein
METPQRVQNFVSALHVAPQLGQAFATGTDYRTPELAVRS